MTIDKNIDYGQVHGEEDLRPKPMSTEEFEVIRLQIGSGGKPLPLRRLAEAVGYSPRQVRNWLDPRVSAEIPAPVRKLMRIFRDRGQAF